MAGKLRISFYGGAREVTGACYLLESQETRVLVDCGMFQGCDDCDVRSHAPFPFDPKGIGALIVTHAHLDHIGRIPKLYRDGFRGRIYATPPTRDLAQILLEDARSFFKPGKELYSEDDIRGALGLFHTVEFGEETRLGEGCSARLLSSAHILGSAMVRIEAGGKIILFTGDLGNDPSILLPSHASAPETQILVVESTYGNKRHRHIQDRTLLLERAIEDAAARRGVLMIPAFATERTQEILYEINEMMQFRRIPPMPVFVDSPLAIKATEIFARYDHYYRDEVRELARHHQNLFRFRHLSFATSVEESKKINAVPPPKVIIAGSGMSAGGRILHHEKRYLPDPNSVLLITGYQGAGSLGRRLVDHAGEVRIHGEPVAVKAEVRIIDGFSAHADEEQLAAFVDEMRDNLERVFVVQGEEAAVLGLQQMIQDRFGIPALAPEYDSSFDLAATERVGQKIEPAAN